MLKPSMQKKIVLFVDSLESGGAQRQIVVLANVLFQRGYDVTILTYYPGDQLSQFLASPAIHRAFLPRRSKYDVGFLFRLRRYFRETRPDCIISYLTTTNFWARTAGRLAGITHIITSERNLNLRPGRGTVLRERLLAGWSSFIVVNSRAGRDNLCRAGIPDAKVVVIYNGLDLRIFSRQDAEQVRSLRQSLQVGLEERLVLLPGRMAPEKNHLLLVDAVRRLDPALRVKVVFAGNEFDRDVKQAIHDRVRASGISEKFQFLGPRSDMSLLYSAADIVVLPSLWEGFPNVLVEAMACGTPVIASAISDNPHIVEDGVTGFLFPSNDQDGLVAALDRMLRMAPASLREMGERGSERAARLCSLESFGEQYCALIEPPGVSA